MSYYRASYHHNNTLKIANSDSNDLMNAEKFAESIKPSLKY